MKTILSLTALSLLTTSLFAREPYQFQYMDQDALRLTMPSLQGNARYVSMGGAFGALGGNLSALSTNPASIGIYRSSEFSFTPALSIGQHNVKVGTGPTRESDQLWNFNMGNIGYVAAWDISKSESQNEWKTVQFGIGFNRLTDFWNRSGYTHYAPAGTTHLDVLTGNANGILQKFPTIPVKDVIDHHLGAYEQMASKASLFVYDSISDEFWNALEYAPTKGLNQRQTTKTSGAIHEFVLSFGGNYGDVLYLGATLGLPSVNFNQEKFLREKAVADEHPRFDEWSIQENLKVSGRGVNLKLGAIVRPTDFMRIGLAFHTPTRYLLKEDFTAVVINENLPSNERDRKQSKLTTYEYRIHTPMKLIGSLGFIVDKKALISLEYEMINYSNMRVNDDFYEFDEDNEFIRNNYQTGGVLKVGAEYRLDAMSLRGGYNYTFSPYSNVAHDFSGHTFSGGVGFHLGMTTIDLAYIHALRNFNMSPYAGMPTDFYNRYNALQHQFLLTVGWRF